MTVNGSGNANADEVDPGVGSGGGHRVEEVVDDGLHPRAERLDAAGREGGRDEPAQPAVVRRVDAEHVPGERGPGRPSATTPPPVASAACMSFESRGSLSAIRASSYPTTSQASCPSASVTGCTAPSSRTAANSGNGSSRS